MRKLYGDSLRKDAGFVKVIKNVASKNVRILESRAGKHAPEFKRVVREVKGTFEKVYEETAEVVEDFIAKCMLFWVSLIFSCILMQYLSMLAGPVISEVVQDTKILLQQSREQLLITFVATKPPLRYPR
jgi:phosphatidylethanolamine N-methyltransferase